MGTTEIWWESDVTLVPHHLYALDLDPCLTSWVQTFALDQTRLLDFEILDVSVNSPPKELAIILILFPSILEHFKV
jgi:hypothetical protein